jgi:hypothetical protein
MCNGAAFENIHLTIQRLASFLGKGASFLGKGAGFRQLHV